MSNLLISVLGNPYSGKTTTWTKLFGSKVNTGKYERQLWLSATEYVTVFVISGSPQERGKKVEEMLGGKTPRIVLCSVQYIQSTPGQQYIEDAFGTYDFFLNNNYELYVQWLNPGFHDANTTPAPDNLKVEDYVNNHGGAFSIRDGKVNPDPRVQEIRDHIYQWAKTNNLLLIHNP